MQSTWKNQRASLAPQSQYEDVSPNRRRKRGGGLGVWSAVIVVLSVTLAGCSASSSPSAAPSGDANTVLKLPDLKGQEIVINTFGGSFGDGLSKNVAPAFEAATGAKVTVTTSCCSTFETQVKGQQFAGDVVFGVDTATLLSWADMGLLKSNPRLPQIAKAHGLEPDAYQDNGITVGYVANVLAWNTQAGNDHPTSWPEFFDTSKFKGTRGLSGILSSNIEAAELGIGTPAASLYPFDMDKSLAALTTLRKNAPLLFWKNGAEQVNQLASGQAAYSLAYSNRIYAAAQQGLPVAMTFNQSVLIGSSAGIPATAKNVDGAVAFLDFFMSPAMQNAFATSSGQSPAYPAATALLDPSVRKYMATAPENMGQTIKLDLAYWRKNVSSVQKTFAAWLSGS